jgi:hypothetical protein
MAFVKTPMWKSWIGGAVVSSVGLVIYRYARGTGLENWSKVLFITLIGFWGILSNFAEQLRRRRFWISFVFVASLYLASWPRLIAQLGDSNLSMYSLVGFVELLVMVGLIAMMVGASA